MTDKKLAELKQLAQAATAGPWEYNDAFVLVRLPEEKELQGLAKPRQGCNIVNVNRAFGADACKANAAFIVAANPFAVLSLIARIEQLEKEADWLARAQADWCREQGVCNECSNSGSCAIEPEGPACDWLERNACQWREAARKSCSPETYGVEI